MTASQIPIIMQMPMCRKVNGIRMNEYHIKAYAKINLGLDVVKKLPNGYHQVKMIMQSIGLRDKLTLRKTAQGITIATDSALLPTDENNLVYKAAGIMLENITSAQASI